MRLMLTYRNTANTVAIVDVHADLADDGSVPLAAYPDDLVVLYSAVEVLSGVDYDKAGLARQSRNPTAPALMLLK